MKYEKGTENKAKSIAWQARKSYRFGSEVPEGDHIPALLGERARREVTP